MRGREREEMKGKGLGRRRKKQRGRKRKSEGWEGEVEEVRERGGVPHYADQNANDEREEQTL